MIDVPSDTIGRDLGTLAEDPRHDLAAQLRRLGVASVVYLRRCMVVGHAAYAIHGADGDLMSVAEDFDLATVLAFEHRMTVVTVH